MACPACDLGWGDAGLKPRRARPPPCLPSPRRPRRRRAEAACLVDDALAWALRSRELTWRLWETPESDAVARGRVRDALSEHSAGEVTVHDAPLVQVVHMVLEMAADEAVSPGLLHAAAGVLDGLVGYTHLGNAAVYGVRAGGWLTTKQMWERVYTTADPAAVVAAAALRALRDAAGIADEDELTDIDCWFMLQEAARLARTAADLAARPAA